MPYINDGLGQKLPLDGDLAPKGAYNDLRAGHVEPIIKLENKGAVFFDTGFWAHTPLTLPSASKVRWWGGFGYKYKSVSAGARVYAGTPFDGTYGMLAEAVYAKATPKIKGPVSADLSVFSVVNENYFGDNAPLTSAAFHIGTVGLPVALSEHLKLEPMAQIWNIHYRMNDGSKTTSTHLQLGVEGTYNF